VESCGVTKKHKAGGKKRRENSPILRQRTGAWTVGDKGENPLAEKYHCFPPPGGGIVTGTTILKQGLGREVWKYWHRAEEKKGRVGITILKLLPKNASQKPI